MDNKIFIIIILMCVVGILIVGTIGFYEQNSLKEKHPKIRNIEDVEAFLDECNSKLFLDCNRILRRLIKSNN